MARDMSDANLIHQSRDEPDYFALLYERYAAQVYRYAYRRTGPQAAEDVVADTFLAAFGRRRRYDVSRPDARPWLFGIATKEIARRHRAEQAHLRAVSRMPAEPTPAGTADQVAADVSAQAARGALAAAVSGLSTGDRDVLLLVAWGDLTYDEVALALGIPIGTVRSRLNRARRKVREALGGANPIDIYEE
jgi:RNA polymerase sigma factor (sigma-70 family)